MNSPSYKVDHKVDHKKEEIVLKDITNFNYDEPESKNVASDIQLFSPVKNIDIRVTIDHKINKCKYDLPKTDNPDIINTTLINLLGPNWFTSHQDVSINVRKNAIIKLNEILNIIERYYGPL